MAAARALSQRAARARAPSGSRPSLGGEVGPASAGPGGGACRGRDATPPLRGAAPLRSGRSPRLSAPWLRPPRFPSARLPDRLHGEKSEPPSRSFSTAPKWRKEPRVPVSHATTRCHLPVEETHSTFRLHFSSPCAARGGGGGKGGPSAWPGPPTPIPLIHGVRSQDRDRRFLHAKYGDSVLHLMPPNLEFFFLIIDSFIQLPEYLLCARHALEA